MTSRRRIRLHLFRTALLALWSLSLPAQIQPPAINEYQVTTANSQPARIMAGPDGALWFTESNANKIARITTGGSITEYPVPTFGTGPNGQFVEGPGDLTVGPDGALWFTEYSANQIGRITMAGIITEYPLPSTTFASLQGITVGPDGALWFCEYASPSTTSKIGRITMAGVITEYPVPVGARFPGVNQITPGPDGDLWFTESNANKIGRITTTGIITDYPVPDSFITWPNSITAGPDGALWFTEYYSNTIGRITTGGVITEYTVPTANSYLNGISIGPDGALWFTEYSANKIGRITTTGVVTEYPLPTPNSGPNDITAGPDGALWFTESNANKIGSAILPPIMETGSIQVTTNLPSATFTITGPATYTRGGTSFTQANAPAGTYTITYGSVTCYSPPISETKTLPAGGTIAFGGPNVYKPNATLSVNVTPSAASSATFSLNPLIPGMRSTGPYPIVQTAVVPATYAISFNQVPGLTTPLPQTLAPDSSCHITFDGAYAPLDGFAVLAVSTNQPVGTFTVFDATGAPLANATNVLSFGPTQVHAGAYSVKYNSLTGFYTPLIQKITTTSGTSQSLQGKYRKLILIGFTGFNDAPSPPNCPLDLALQDVTGSGWHNSGSGIEYTSNTWNTPGRGITTMLYKLLQSYPLLASGAHMTAFTFYSTDGHGHQIGNSCNATTATDVDHFEATQWVNSLHPTHDDLVVIMGHSYGGNRARLFSYWFQQQYGFLPTALFTIDPIDWDYCSLQSVQLQLFSGGLIVPPCDQSPWTYSGGAVINQSFHQTLGYSHLTINYPGGQVTLSWNVKGYALAGGTSALEPDYHDTIDDDSGLQAALLSTISSIVTGPEITLTPNAATRTTNAITMPVVASVTGFGTALGLTINSASLNGVGATNLPSGGVLGDIGVGSFATSALTFPGLAAPSGGLGMLSLSGTYSYGQVFSNTFRVKVP